MNTNRVTCRVLLAATLLFAIAPLALAGEVKVAWGAAPTATGYRVYSGTTSKSYGSPKDVGNVLEATAASLPDCKASFFALTAYNAAGESAYSQEVSSWPRPVINTASPNVLMRGTQATLTISGVNFQVGDTLKFANTGVTITSSSITSCNQMSVTVNVSATAPLGASDFTVTHGSGVIGTAIGLVTIQSPNTAPTVLSTNPASGATGIATNIKPTVTFSEAIGAITSSTVRLLNDASSPVAQAAGSPQLSGDGKTATITPAAALANNKVYRIQVIGGASGVKDLEGAPLASDYIQTPGFTTVSDNTAPGVSAVTSTAVQATTATITWTTNEVADSTVYYRKSGTTTYQTKADSAMVTSHSVPLTGLSPETTYEYHVESTDAAGNTTTSSPDKTFKTGVSQFSYLIFEAESGVNTPPVEVTEGTAAFGGSWIDTPAGSGTGTPTAPIGKSVHGVNVPKDGTWTLWVRIFGNGPNNDSWFESVDGGTRVPIFPAQQSVWTWVKGQAYTLTAGQHTVELGGREAEARADRLLLTNDSTFVPGDVPGPDIDPPTSVLSFSAAVAGGQIHLNWTNPTDGDFKKTVIRYRTDGTFPTSPIDGILLVENTGAPGSAGNYTVTAPAPGTAYSYAAFAVDAAGNVAVAAQAEADLGGTPAAPQFVTIK